MLKRNLSGFLPFVGILIDIAAVWLKGYISPAFFWFHIPGGGLFGLELSFYYFRSFFGWNMQTRKTKTLNARTLYGVNATVIIGPGFLHRGGYGKLLIPHPPVINWLLRRGLAPIVRENLSFSHEFGHLQSAPPALLYTAANFAALLAAGKTTVLTVLLLLISTHAAYEIMAEIITIRHNRQLYRHCYENVSKIPRAIFWFSMILLVWMGWIIVLH